MPDLSPRAAQLAEVIRARAAAAERHPTAQALPSQLVAAAREVAHQLAADASRCEVCHDGEAARWLYRASWGSSPRAACPRCIAHQRHRSTYTAEPYVTRPLEG